ncbi:type II toxin-antitoxin system HipA family toxin [Methylophilus sp. 5]|uniref:type II toxin-antitoxin system HipA family toxin n=1 Tax=Methylophilus sp. 5 TaxID=1112274 RepID=UPI00048FB73F|nr:HipA domain-containing protein [Methylophilus sp. 5]
MISNRTIYIGLASRSDAEVRPAAILKLSRRGVVESSQFAYGNGFLAAPDALALNPLHLPLGSDVLGIAERRVRDGGALPLTLRDALPDAWGRQVLESQQGKTLDDIDVLLLTNAHRVGAMTFAEVLPIQPQPADADLFSLNEMSDAVKRLEFAMEIPLHLRRLLNKGGSLGGARPKADFIHDKERWIAKFPANGDDHDVELLEAAVLELAALCGIDVSPHKLERTHSGHALLVQRFDRVGNIDDERRIHYLSASALLNVPYQSNGGSYIEFAQVIRKISAKPEYDLHQLYRRMVFNLIIDNTDDHVKNHGMLHVKGNQYQLSPAFDVVMQLTNVHYQALAISPGNNLSKLSLAIQAAPHFGIHTQAAKALIDDIAQQASLQLLPIIEKLGGDAVLMRRVQQCLDRQIAFVYD